MHSKNDNFRVDTTRDVKNWIAQKQIKVFSDWSSRSPDPIEHLWGELKRRHGKYSVHTKNLCELEKVL